MSRGKKIILQGKDLCNMHVRSATQSNVIIHPLQNGETVEKKNKNRIEYLGQLPSWDHKGFEFKQPAVIKNAFALSGLLRNACFTSHFTFYSTS